jgi:hypothetical protein
LAGALSSVVRPASYILVTPAGAVLSLDRKDSPVKTRLLPIAIIVGALMLALLLADDTPWPHFG